MDGATHMNRRHFLQSMAGAAAAAPVAAAAPAAIRLGIDTYSIRDLRWNPFQILDYAARLKVDCVQVSVDNFESLDAAYLAKVKEHASRLQIPVELGYGCIGPLSSAWNPRQGDPTRYLLEGLRVARELGTRTVRCFAGGPADRTGSVPLADQREAIIKGLRSVRSQVLDAGIKIAVENHADFLARELKAVIEEAGKDFVGCTLDTGNPVMVAEDPLLTLEVLAPYAVSTHFRDSVVFEHPRGAAAQWVALGDGSIDMRRLADRFRELCPAVPMHLEIITGRRPKIIPYLEADYWKAYSSMPAGDFARFLKLVKQGHPLMENMLVSEGSRQAPEYKAALREQQRIDLERSIAYAEKAMGAGVRWRS